MYDVGGRPSYNRSLSSYSPFVHSGCQFPSPAFFAAMMACARSARQSLVRMEETLLRTVFSVIESCLAMSGLCRCFAMRERTCTSRAVSSGKGLGVPGRLRKLEEAHEPPNQIRGGALARGDTAQTADD